MAEAEKVAESPPERATEPQDKRKRREPSKHHVGAAKPIRRAKQLPAAVAQKLPEFIDRYLKRESVQTMAEECGEDRRRLYEWMLADLGAEGYEQAVTKVLVKRIADADVRLDTAATTADIARAREVARFARMDFERRRPHLYAAKPLQVTVNNVNVDAGLVGSISELIDRKRDAVEAEVVEEQRSNPLDTSGDT